MLSSSWRLIFLGVLLLATGLLSACGGGSGSTGLIGGGTAVASSAGSLALALDKTTAAAGADVVTATVTLTALSGQPVNGINVVLNMVYNGVVIAQASGNTNTSGIVLIPMDISLVPADRTVYFQATSSGITSSSSLAVTVKAPVLASTIPTTTSGSAVVGGAMQFVLQGDTLTFKNGIGNPLASANITFTLTSQTDSSGLLLRNGTIIDSVTNPSFTVTTDSTGTASTGITAVISAPSTAGTNNVVTFYYTISAVYGGFTYTSQLSSQFTVAGTAAPAPGAITATPAALAFVITDLAGTSKVVTISGGTAPYSISGTYPDQTVVLSGSTITVTSKSDGGATSKQAVITLSDSAGSTVPIVITYTK